MAERSTGQNRNFEEIALPHLDAVYRAAVGLCGQSSPAEDLTQTTFLKAWERFDTFEAGTDCKSWLMRILRNTWIDTLRRKSTAGATVPLDENLAVQPPRATPTVWTNASDLLENFSDPDVIRALGELSDDQRLTLFLVDVEQLSVNEVAKILSIAPGTVKSRSCRARNQLKEKLKAHAEALGLLRREK